MAEVIKPAFFEEMVNAGEERLLLFLEVKLPEDYYLIPNVEIASTNPRNNQTQYWEYDLIVVAPHAVYCIENKDWRGRLEGDDNYWYLNDRQRPNPLKLGRQKTAILHSKLQEVRPAWGKVRVENMVTLSFKSQNLHGISGEGQRRTFLLNDDLIEFITNPYNAGVAKNAIAEFKEEIKDYLSGEQSEKKPEEKKEIQGYEIIEILDREPNYTEYLVKPKGVTSSIRKRVKEYALDIAGLDSEALRIREEQITNQYKALNKIKAKPFILNVEFKIDNETHLFYEITDFLDESSLRAEMKRKTFTNEEKIGIISNLIAALKEAHKENIYHRDINPDNVFIYSGYAYLGNFGKAYFTDHSEQGYTVMPTLNESTATPYHAIELLAKDASRASDIYSLGVLIYELFVGKIPIQSPYELNRLEGKLPADRMPTSVNPNLPKWLDELCNNTILTDETKRYDNLEELENFIKKSTQREDTPVKKQDIVKQDSFDFQVGSTIGVYTIHKILGKGGYSQVFAVKHGLQGKMFAMKLFHESVSLKSVTDEYEALKDLKHPNIVEFIWNDRTVNGQFFTLMEYLDGENLKNYARGDLSLPSNKIFQMVKEILSALVEMQKKTPALLHRDIKPQNIIWENKNRFVLIDFNVATALEANKDFVGTNPYLAPDIITDNMKVNWDKSADTFALGITLYELACKTYPWPGKMPLMGKDPIHPQECNEKLSPTFSEFMLKAIGTTREKRFANASEMLESLQKIGEENILHKAEEKAIPEVFEILPDGQKQNIINYVNSLYSQSKRGNFGTRAHIKSSWLDTATYVETKLDLSLLPAILDGNFRLVIITGNAGDGKTAFIKKIEEKAEDMKALQHSNGSTFNIKGIPFQSNYDGSQDEDEKANNLVLEDFFKPFENCNDFVSSKAGRIIAINEGRLVEFLQTSSKHKGLADIIDKYFYQVGHYHLPDGLLIINLNLRSIVATNNSGQSIFRKQVQKLTDPSLWQMCYTCPHTSKCFIRYNVQSFNDTSAGKEIINRMEWLLRTISLKKELHITIRDLRSFISYMLTRDFVCEEIPQLIANTSIYPDEYWSNFYFNITKPLSDSAQNDRLIKLLRETDIAEVSSPAEDRDLYFSLHRKENYLEFESRDYNMIDVFNNQKSLIPSYDQSDEILNRIKNKHKTFIRHQYFEGKTDFKKRIPYKSVSKFYNILILKNDLEISDYLNNAKLNISKAISLNEGCDNEFIYEKSLVLSSNQVSDPIAKSYRLFPLSDFALTINQTEHLIKYLEYEPDSLVFKHNTEKHIKLIVSLDLYEMLSFISKGYNPSLNDLKGRYIELQIFKNLLENLSYNEVILTKDNIDFYKISKGSNNKLVLETLEIDMI
jgi:serine/threonine protein kinase